MQRLDVVFRQEARDDLKEIFRFVAARSASHAVARSFVRRILDRCERIADAPRGGRPRDDIEPGLRTVPFERRAVIAYRLSEDRVQIVRVFYAGRDWDRLLRSTDREPAADEGEP